ncbi:PD-(D/E)XK nuclease family protein [Corynebacterium pygosceleis]|uniref:PD-(D/E)XK nuclease family protein n=1 Tax=Corynebacterium pygosceleis TaxID=2800406 RepID=A0A9Q4CA80_9CORY|nr:PD-(D/E)XK nuclease family protein [Corynebacterium pygosceleis]MCK7636432.1 PD-(D/E)XK nuclease family protein [Corynebacterium pygosceleis]MCK7675005.1 PD-(D/E)XK nuclease family protein [Corynebacterium pygosceleis]MCL0121416.1 PD-(D/E)XK nuclease family protein [Corynebacterium pygosceleis]MCX7469254.1 PD-(D/E)XK nuclease family protein [Corynebacterium pygosceleis]
MSADTVAVQLAAAIAEVRRTDRLRPVTILCGPTARGDVLEQLTSTGTLLGVTVTSCAGYILGRSVEVTERRDGRVLLDRSRITGSVMRLLTDTDTEFTRYGTADQPATRSALVSIVTELLSLPGHLRDRTEGRLLPGACLDVARRVRALNPDCFTWHDACLHALTPPPDDAAVIVVDVVPTDPTQRWFLDELDALRIDTVGQCPTGERPEPVVWSCSDENDEVMRAVRHIRKLVAEGTPPHRIACGWCSPDYGPRLSDALTGAAVPFTGFSDLRWSDAPEVRALLRILALDPQVLPRRELAAILGTGAIRHPVDGKPVHRDIFDRVTRRAERFDVLADWERPRVTDVDSGEPDGHPDTDRMRRWVLALRDGVTALRETTTWDQFTGALRDLVAAQLRPGKGPERAAALAAIDRAVEGLSGMTAQLPRFRIDLATELLRTFLDEPQPVDAPVNAISIGGIDDLPGRILDAVLILGATEKALPGSVNESSAITFAQRGQTPEGIQDTRIEVFHRACATAPGHAVVSYPRSHCDGSGGVGRSRLIDSTPAVVSGGLVDALSGEDVAVPADPRELLLAQILSGAEPDPTIRRAADIIGARETGAAAGEPLSEYNGWIPGFTTDLFRRELSATALESYPESPLTFLIERILGCRILEDTPPDSGIDARDRGTVYHRIFELWTRETWLDATPRPILPTDIDWVRARSRLDDITDEQLAAMAPASGEGARWSLFRAEVRTTVGAWFEEERREALEGWVPVGAELAFGGTHRDGSTAAHPLEITLPGGTVLKFRGSVDRLDYHPGRRVLRVTDYKSGKQSHSGKISQAYPTGEKILRLQLALYGAAVRAALDAAPLFPGLKVPGSPTTGAPLVELPDIDPPGIESRYLFFTDHTPRDSPRTSAITVDDTVLKHLESTLLALHDLIGSGVFPPQSRNGNTGNIPRPNYLRLGAANYDRAAEALTPRGFNPLRITADDQPRDNSGPHTTTPATAAPRKQ